MSESLLLDSSWIEELVDTDAKLLLLLLPPRMLSFSTHEVDEDEQPVELLDTFESWSVGELNANVAGEINKNIVDTRYTVARADLPKYGDFIVDVVC